MAGKTGRNIRWIKNLEDASRVDALRYPGLFAAGATQAIFAGQILERTAATNTEWVPLDSDFDPTVGAGLAIAGQDIASGDLAGFYELIVPRPGDVFEFSLNAASALVPETNIFFSAAAAEETTLQVTGTNAIGFSVHQPNQPGLQKQLSEGQLGDKGVTFRSTNRVWMVFRTAVSHYSTLQQA